MDGVTNAGRWEDDPDLFQRTFPMNLRPQAPEIIRTWLFATVLRSHFEHDTLPWSDLRSPCNQGTDQWSTGLPAIAIADAGGNGDPCADQDTSGQAGALTYTTPEFQSATTLAGPIDASLFGKPDPYHEERLSQLAIALMPGAEEQRIRDFS